MWLPTTLNRQVNLVELNTVKLFDISYKQVIIIKDLEMALKTEDKRKDISSPSYFLERITTLKHLTYKGILFVVYQR